ncbi:MAG: NADH-quinone oxidoreductase subunit N [Gemmatimonadaceae bacterium]
MNGMTVSDLIPELALLVGSVAVLISALFLPRRLQPMNAALALLTVVIAVVAAVALPASLKSGFQGGAMHPWQHLSFSGTYAIDSFAIAAKFIVLGVTALVIALSVDWFRSDPRQGEYYALLLMSALGAITLAGAADMMEMVLAMLLSSATGYVLVAFHRKSRRSAEAAIKYYLLGALTNGAMLYGVALFFGLSGTTVFSDMAAPLRLAGALPLVAAWSLVVVGLAFKIGAVPAHAWLPDVADGAPAPVAAFVTVAPKVGALIVLARFVSVLPEDGAGWRVVIAAVAALTMTLGNIAALWQDDIRRLLGWSAVSQTGYALMAIVALGRSSLALPALVYFLAAYALGNVGAFAVVVALRGLAKRERYAGLARSHPWLAAALTICFLSFVGIPPLAGFAGKLTLFGATIDAGYTWLAVLAVLNSVLSLAYYARFLGPIYFDEAPEQSGASMDRTAAGVAIVSAAALVGLGLGADIVFNALANSVLLR